MTLKSLFKRPSRSDSEIPHSEFRIPDSNASGTAIDLDALVALREEARHLDIAPRGKILATRSGGHLSRFRGRGMEFDESRAYQAGDDPRNMDWRVTARTGKPHVKQFREERERPVWLAVDLGEGMHFGTRVAFKSVVAARAAALLAWAAADQGDRVGGLAFCATRHYERPPVARTRGLLPLLKALSELTTLSPGQPSPGDTGIPHSEGFPSLSAAADHLSHRVRPGSLVFLVSDFAGLTEADGAWMARLGAGSELVLVHVYDPLETTPPPPGRYAVTDGRRRGLLDTTRNVQRSAWLQRYADRVALLERLGLLHHAHLVSLGTHQDVGDTLDRGLRPRRRSGGVR